MVGTIVGTKPVLTHRQYSSRAAAATHLVLVLLARFLLVVARRLRTAELRDLQKKRKYAIHYRVRGGSAQQSFVT